MHAVLYSPESGLQISSSSQSRSSGQLSSTPEEQRRGRSKRLSTPERPIAKAIGDVVFGRKSAITVSPFVGRRTESGKPMVRSRISSRGKGQSSSAVPVLHHISSSGVHHKGQRGYDSIEPHDDGMGRPSEALDPQRSRSRSPDQPLVYDMAANDTDRNGPSTSAIMDAPSTPNRSVGGRPPTPPSSRTRAEGAGSSSSSSMAPVVLSNMMEQSRQMMNDEVQSELLEQRRITAELQQENIKLMGAATASYHGLYNEGRTVIAEASEHAANEKRRLEAYANQMYEAEMTRARDAEMSEAARARQAVVEANVERNRERDVLMQELHTMKEAMKHVEHLQSSEAASLSQRLSRAETEKSELRIQRSQVSSIVSLNEAQRLQLGEQASQFEKMFSEQRQMFSDELGKRAALIEQQARDAIEKERLSILKEKEEMSAMRLLQERTAEEVRVARIRDDEERGREVMRLVKERETSEMQIQRERAERLALEKRLKLQEDVAAASFRTPFTSPMGGLGPNMSSTGAYTGSGLDERAPWVASTTTTRTRTQLGTPLFGMSHGGVSVNPATGFVNIPPYPLRSSGGGPPDDDPSRDPGRGNDDYMPPGQKEKEKKKKPENPPPYAPDPMFGSASGFIPPEYSGFSNDRIPSSSSSSNRQTPFSPWGVYQLPRDGDDSWYMPGGGGGPPDPPPPQGGGGNGDDDDEDAREDEDGRLVGLLRKVLLREADGTKGKAKETEIVIKVAPSPGNYDTWNAEVLDIVVAASGIGDAIVPWVRKSHRDGVTFEDLADPEGRRGFDMKLAAALKSSVKTNLELSRAINDTSQKMLSVGDEMLKGRQILHMIHRWFATSSVMKSFTDINILSQVSLKGNYLSDFLHRWDKVLIRIDTKPNDLQLRSMFHRQVEPCQVLSQEMNSYKHMLDSDPRKCYRWLRDIVEKEIFLHRQKINNAHIVERIVGPSTKSTHNALPATTGGRKNELSISYEILATPSANMSDADGRHKSDHQRRKESRTKRNDKTKGKGGRGQSRGRQNERKGGGRGHGYHGSRSKSGSQGSQSSHKSGGSQSGSRSGSHSSYRSSSNNSQKSSSSTRNAAIKQGICIPFLEGKCTRGDKCKYKHQALVQAAASYAKTQTKSTSNVPCQYWMMNGCTKGSECPFKHFPELEGSLKKQVANAVAAEALVKGRGPTGGGRGSRHRHRSNSAGSHKGSSKSKKHDRAVAVAEIMDEYDATVATVVTYGYVDDEEFDFTRRDYEPSKYNAMVVTRSAESPRDPPHLVEASDSEGAESDGSVHSGIADSIGSISDHDQDGVAAIAARPYGRLKARFVCAGRPRKQTSWGIIEVEEFNVDDKSVDAWRSVTRRQRKPGYRHDDSRRRLAGTDYSAREAAKRLSIRVGTFVTSNPRRLFTMRERNRLQSLKAIQHTVPAARKMVKAARLMSDGYPEQFIADTGAGVNLMSKDELDSRAKRRVEKLKTPLRLNTANGVIAADEVLPMELPVMDDTLDFVLLENTPAVVSVGERCVTKGYGFYWPPYGDPFFVCPGTDGNTRRVVPLKTSRHVPMIVNGAVARRVPKGWIRRRLRVAVEGDSQDSSGSDIPPEDSDGEH